jgi:hypothetical protein
MRLKVVGVVGAVLGALFVVPPSSASAEEDWWCHGTAVERCATVSWDRSNDTFRARARITDAAGGGNYEVRVVDVKLQRTRGADLVTVRTADDYDGWHDVQDLAATTAVDPCSVPGQSYRVIATFSWRGASTGQETWRPDNTWGFHCE